MATYRKHTNKVALHPSSHGLETLTFGVRFVRERGGIGIRKDGDVMR